MTRKLRTVLTASAMALTVILPHAASSAEFNQSQREEMGQIIREYLLQNPEVLREAFQELQKREETAAAEQSKQTLADNAATIFRSDYDLVAGNPDGSVTMVEFFDYNCGYCKRAMPDVLKLIDEDKDLRIVMKEFPILGPGSTFAARAALASKNQGKYWDYHLALLGHRGAVTEPVALEIAKTVGLDVDKLKADMDADEIKQTIGENMAIAQSLGINGTPAFIIDDKVIPGAVGYSALSGAISQVRESGGCQIC